MKAAVLVLAVCGFSAVAMADETSTAQADQTLPVEQYSYGTNLDIAKVVAQDEVPYVCGVVPVHMTYVDSHGQRHVVEYEVMGTGCSNG